MGKREWRQKLYTKRMAALHIAALAVIVFAIWIGFGPLNDVPFFICSCVGSGAAAVLATAYIRILRLYGLMHCTGGVKIDLQLAFGADFGMPDSPYDARDMAVSSAVWVRGTRGLASLIVIGLAIFYFIKTWKQGQRKDGMAICLVFGILLCMAWLTTTAF